MSIVAIIVAVLLLASYLLGPLRTFIPNYLKLTGTVFTDRTYLVLFQNNYELRPTGGFISAYGELTFKHGIPTGLEFYDVYGEIDEHEWTDPPHYPMEALLGGPDYGGYTFRDTNYYVDFEDSAEEIIDFYQKTNPDTDVDGIVTVDFAALESFVEKYEPLTADEYELTSNNLFETLSAEVSDINRHSLEDLSTRKNIMKDVVKDLIKKIVLHPFQINSFSHLVAQNFDEKHMVLWFNSKRLENKVKELGWSATMPETYDDILAVNEANLGGMKNDRYIARNVKYELTIEDESINANVQITLDHYGGDNIPLSGDYKGYVRAFVHEDARQITTAYDEEYDNYVAFGEIVYLEKSESQTVEFEYELPLEIVDDGVYILDLIKQPGTSKDHYEIIVHAPQGSTLESEIFETHEEHAYASIDLIQDVKLGLKIHPDETAPRVHSHEIVELNKIWIGFNEPLECTTTSDHFNYSITDLDVTNPDRTDVVTVDTITCNERHVWLDTRGMTGQDEEFYDITVRNIRDKSGNYLDPNPRTLTVVQRNL